VEDNNRNFSEVRKSNHDSTLLHEVKRLSRGDTQAKIKALSLILKHRDQLSAESIKIVFEFADKEQPKEIRLAVAKSFGNLSLSNKQHTSLIKILANDPDNDVKGEVSRELAKEIEHFNLLSRTQSEYQMGIAHMQAEQRRFMSEISSLSQPQLSKIANEIQRQQQERIANIHREIQRQQQKRIAEVSGMSFSPIIGNISNYFNLIPIKAILRPTISYYPSSELSDIEKEPKIPQRSKAERLSEELRRCNPGREHWEKYQDICRDILTYCLVPPLDKPLEQNRDKGGIHIRDLVFYIPYDIGTFWNFIILKFTNAFVIECKNYSELLSENDFIISSKYLDPKGLTNLGFVVTREGLSKNAKEAQTKFWTRQETMLICLSDDDLVKMLELKEKREEAWKVLDLAIKKFRE
jgi:hypothetical protein